MLRQEILNAHKFSKEINGFSFASQKSHTKKINIVDGRFQTFNG